MRDESVHCVATSPPYWGLRNYGVDGQLGLERTPEEYVAKMVAGFREVRRVLRKDGTLWLNLGDCYASGAGAVGECPGGGEQGDQWKGYRGTRQSGKHEYISNAKGPMIQPNRMPIVGLKPKDLVMMPARVALALQADGWWVRSDIIWAKKNPMPESVTDRPTKSHEYLFLLTKSERYYYDHAAIQETSVTDDVRRPYTSEGAWQLDGRPSEQRHSGEPRGKTGKNAFRGQGHNRYADNGRANRNGRELKEIGAGITRNKRSVWEIATSPFPEAHFATFPPKLVEPCILAGTSEHGCCPPCGAPWKRLLAPSPEYAKRLGKGVHNHEDDLTRGMRVDKKINAEYVTIGWEPTCKCTAGEPIPCTVLDPFNGAGTTGLVATRLGRNYLGIELNPEYATMAERRILNDAPLFNGGQSESTESSEVAAPALPQA